MAENTHVYAIDQDKNLIEVKKVGLTGKYTDLDEKPIIPDISDYYDKSEIDTKLASKANSADVPARGSIASGNTGYVTGGDAYIAIPSQYLKDASVARSTLTITKQDGSTVTFSGGGSGTGKVYKVSFQKILREGETRVSIAEVEFDPTNDTIDLYTNGLHLLKDLDYTIEGDYVVMTDAPTQDLALNFEVWKFDNASRLTINVIDNIYSTSVTDGLSANQGRILNENLDTRQITNIQMSPDKRVITIYKTDGTSFQFRGRSEGFRKIEYSVDIRAGEDNFVLNNLLPGDFLTIHANGIHLKEGPNYNVESGDTIVLSQPVTKDVRFDIEILRVVDITAVDVPIVDNLYSSDHEKALAATQGVALREMIETEDAKLDATKLELETEMSDNYNDLENQINTTKSDVIDIIDSSYMAHKAVISIADSDWNNKACTKNIAKLKTTSDIFIVPSSFNYDIECSCSTDGVITFTCGTVPTTSVTVLVIY